MQEAGRINRVARIFRQNEWIAANFRCDFLTKQRRKRETTRAQAGDNVNAGQRRIGHRRCAMRDRGVRR